MKYSDTKQTKDKHLKLSSNFCMFIKKSSKANEIIV